jgi:hypothetical protein
MNSDLEGLDQDRALIQSELHQLCIGRAAGPAARAP